MRLPARFQPEHIAGNVLLAQFAGEGGDFGFGGGAAGAVPVAEAPLRQQAAAAAEEHVAAHRVEQRRAAEEVERDAARDGDLRHDRGGRVGGGVKFRLRELDVTGGCGCFPAGEGGVAAGVECRIAGGVEQDAVSGGGEVERRGRVAVAGVGDRVAVDSERPLLPGLAQALELESESVEILPRPERQFEAAAAGGDGEADLFRWKRCGLRFRQGGDRFGERRFPVGLGGGNAGFRFAEGEFPDSGIRGFAVYFHQAEDSSFDCF